MSSTTTEVPAPLAARDRPAYFKVFLTFARNSLVRSMMFRANFLIDTVGSMVWILMNLGFYILIYQYTPSIGSSSGPGDPGWGKYQFFAFIATTVLVNSLVQAFFMPNIDELSEQIRTGSLDFALVKPIDTQFLISLEKIDWSSLGNFTFAVGLLGYSLWSLAYTPTIWQLLIYPVCVLCGVAILYSLMIALASMTIWLGRNQSLYDFWFYVTNFSRYPMEIYRGPIGTPLRQAFTFVLPILIVVNVPARIVAMPLSAQHWHLAMFLPLATIVSLWLSRMVFQAALASYRSASS